MAASAPASAGTTDAVTFEQGNAEELPYPDRSFDCVTIAFGIRNVPRIERALSEAHRVLRIGGRFLCLEFSSVDVPGVDALYELYSFKMIPWIGKAVTGDRESYQYLVEIDPQVSQAEGLHAHDRGRRLPPRLVHADDRRRGGAAFGLALVISAFSHLIRLGRAGFVFAREGVFALVDTRPLPLPAKTAIALARLIERPTAKDGSSRLAAALTKLGPTYVKLGQFLATRPDVVGKEIARDLESLQDKMAPFPQAQAEAAIAAAFEKPLKEVYASFGPAVAAASIAQVHRAEIDEDGVRKAVAVKILRPGVERRFKVRSRRLLFCRAQGGKPFARSAAAAAGRSGGDARPLGGDGNGFPPGSRRAVGDGARTPARTRISACRRWTGTAPRARCSRWNGSTARRSTTAPRSRRAGSTCRRSATR